MTVRAIARLAVTMALTLPGLAAGQVEAWRAQHDSELSDASTFFNFIGLFSLQAQRTTVMPGLSHFSALTVSDGFFHTLLVRHDAMGEIEWTSASPALSVFAVVATDNAGNAYVNKSEDGCTGLRKLAPDGTTVWNSAPVDPPACDVSLSAIEVAADGGIYAAGVANTLERLVIVRFSSDGEVEWTFERQLDPDTQGSLNDLAVDSTGAVLAVGSFWNPSTDYILIKLTSGGSLAWERTFDGGSIDFANTLAVGPEDRVTISGLSRVPDSGPDYYTIQYDADGDERWNARIARHYPAFAAFAPTIVADSAGNVFLAGAGGSESAATLLLMKYSDAGAELAEFELPSPSHARYIAIAEGEGRVYVAGHQIVDDLLEATVFAFDLEGALLWEKGTDVTAHTFAGGLSVGEGLVVMAGDVASPESDFTDTFWLALDPDGELVWSAGEPVSGKPDYYCGPTGSGPPFNRSGTCLHVASDGSTYLTGSDFPGPNQFSFSQRTVKLGPAGAEQWTKGFIEDGEEVFGQGAIASTLGASGSLHSSWTGIAGSDPTDENHARFPTYDSGGTETSNPSYTPIQDVRAMGTDSTGAVYAVGSRQIFTTPTTAIIDLLKFQPAGTQAWVRHFEISGTNQPLAMLVTGDDRIVYVGRATPQAPIATQVHGLARAYDPDGDVLFTRTLDSAGGDAWLAALAAVPGGTDLVAAGRAKSATDYDALVVRLDAAGEVEWRRDLDGGGDQSGDDEATAVAVDPAGNVYVAGHTWNGDDRDVLVVKLDGAGNELWRRAIDSGHGDDEALAAAFDAPGPGGSAGSLWVAGLASNGNDTDALTLRFDTDGDELFRAVVAGTEQRDDEHYDLVVGPPGHATVAGISAEIDQSYNFQAIRYVPSPLDVDYDGEADTSTDGALIAQWLFGVLGAGPAMGVIDPPCVRCTPEEIEAHLSAIDGLLDVDGNGEARPLTDGVLLLRWLSDFHGDALIEGAVDLDLCTRCDAPAIEAYLETLGG